MKCSSFPQTESARKPTVHAGSRLPWRQNSPLETESGRVQSHTYLLNTWRGDGWWILCLKHTVISDANDTKILCSLLCADVKARRGREPPLSVTPPCKFTSSNTSWLSCCGFHTCGIENDGIQRGVAQFLRPFLHQYWLSNDWYKHI